MKTIIVLTAVSLAGLGLVGCGGGAAGAPGERTVVAGFYPVAYAAAEIGGAAVDVENLTPPGAEPHDLELSVRDVESVRGADVVLYLGRFQPALEEAAEGAEGEAIDLLGGIELRTGEDHEADPHVWLDPLRYAEIAKRIGRALDGDPADLVKRLRALDDEYERGLADCERNELVVSHAAFGYLANRYRLRQIAITGLSPEAEASPRELERVADSVRESGATTVFFETLVSPDLAETVARETGAETSVLDPIEGLTEDGAERGEDYFSLMRTNLETLREALGCR